MRKDRAFGRFLSRRRRKNMRQIDRNDALNIVYNAARAI